MTLNERVMVGRERDKGRCGKGGKGKEGTARERERERESMLHVSYYRKYLITL